jgi:hypothetical protein
MGQNRENLTKTGKPIHKSHFSGISGLAVLFLAFPTGDFCKEARSEEWLVYSAADLLGLVSAIIKTRRRRSRPELVSVIFLL